MTYGGSGVEHYMGTMMECKEGGYLVAGGTSANDGEAAGNHGGQDILLVKTDYNGNLVSSHCYGGSHDESIVGVMQLPDNNYLLGSTTASADGDITVNNGASDGWLLKIANQGLDVTNTTVPADALLYPTITNSELNVRIGYDSDNMFNITDISGRQMPLHITYNMDHYKFNVSMLPPGVYILHMVNRVSSYSGKFIVR